MKVHVVVGHDIFSSMRIMGLFENYKDAQKLCDKISWEPGSDFAYISIETFDMIRSSDKEDRNGKKEEIEDTEQI